MFKKADFFNLLLLAAGYLIISLQNLTKLPVFGDEAIYIRWSQIIKSVETLRFIPVTDGKQPLFMWLTVPVLKFVSDPLLSARLVSVAAGLGTMLTIYLILRIILKVKPAKALTVGIIYIFTPFVFFFNRVAVPDNLLAFWGVLSLLFSLLLAKHPRLDLAMILGTVLGLAWLTKSPAMFFILLSIGTFIFVNFRQPKTFIFPIISSAISFIIYNILRLGPQFNQIAIRNQDYIWPLTEIIKHPFDPFFPHLTDTVDIFLNYFSLPVIILVVLSFVYTLTQKKFNKYLFLIACWSILPLIATLTIAKVFTARYILFTIPPLIVTAGYFISNLPTKVSLLVPLILIPNVIFIYNFSTKPFSTAIPHSESGYTKDWTSGWGIKEASVYLIERSRTANVIVGTEGAFGTLPDGLQIYTNDISHLTVFGVGLGFTKVPEKLLDARRHGDEVYLIGNKSRLRLDSDQFSSLTLVSSTIKPDGDSLQLYRLQ